MYYICTLHSYKEVSIFMLTELNCLLVFIFKKPEVSGYFSFFKNICFFIYMFVKCLISSLFSSRP